MTLATTTKAYLLGTSTTPTSTAQAVTALADTGVYLDTTAGKLTATSFAGNGATLTSLNASNLGSGTVPAARLPAASTSTQGAMSAADKTKLNALVQSIELGTMTIASSGWTAGTWNSSISSAGFESSGGSCYYATVTVSGAADGDRFVCTGTAGNRTAIYAIPVSGAIRFETAVKPTTSVIIQGYIRKESA